MSDLISIIIPTFNRAHLIGATLDSILAQTYQNWECIIVDDGSTDTTEELIATYIAADSRFQFFHRPSDRPKGGNACRNYGFEKSKGVFIKWFDSDDLMKSEFLSVQCQALIASPELDFCAAFCEVFSDQDLDTIVELNPSVTTRRRNILSDYIYGKIFFLTPSIMWRRAFLTGKELFDEQLFRSQEADFNFRRLLENPMFKYQTQILFCVRRGHISIDSNSHGLNSLNSQFKYFQKVIEGIKLYIEDRVERRELIQYLLYRQSILFVHLRLKANRNLIYEAIIVNINSSGMQRLDRYRLKVGLFCVKKLGHGYRLIANPKFKKK